MGQPEERPRQPKTVAVARDRLPIDGKEGGRRFESVRGLPQSTCKRTAFVGGSDDVSERRRPQNVHRSERQRLSEGVNAVGERASGLRYDVHLTSTQRKLARRRPGE